MRWVLPEVRLQSMPLRGIGLLFTFLTRNLSKVR